MKTRIIQTRFWEDDIVLSVSKDARLLWIFLLTNDKLGMTNYVKLPDSFIQYYTGLTNNELKKSKEEIQSTGKIFFHKDWIYIPNLERENKYRNSPKLEIPYKTEISHIPESIILEFNGLAKAFNSTIDSTIASTSDSLIKPKLINHKSKTKTHKSDFEAFWKKYPKKVGKTKAETSYKNKATSKGQEQLIMNGLEKYLRKWEIENTDKQYIPNATTWLNQERWNDEIEIYKKGMDNFVKEQEEKWESTKERREESLIEDNGELVPLSTILERYKK